MTGKVLVSNGQEGLAARSKLIAGGMTESFGKSGQYEAFRDAVIKSIPENELAASVNKYKGIYGNNPALIEREVVNEWVSNNLYNSPAIKQIVSADPQLATGVRNYFNELGSKLNGVDELKAVKQEVVQAEGIWERVGRSQNISARTFSENAYDFIIDALESYPRQKVQEIIDNVSLRDVGNSRINDIQSKIWKSKLSNEDKVILEQRLFYKAQEEGIATDIQVIADPSYIDEAGYIKWPPQDGFEINPNTGNAEKYVNNPRKGELLDRCGSEEGIFLCPIRDRSYNYSERALPYIENIYAKHRYRVARNFNELSDAIRMCKDKELIEDIAFSVREYNIDIDRLYVYEGRIAPAFGNKGGGIQCKMPLSVELLERLGFLVEIFD